MSRVSFYYLNLRVLREWNKNSNTVYVFFIVPYPISARWTCDFERCLYAHIPRVFLFSFTLASDSNTSPLHILSNPHFSLCPVPCPGRSLSRLMLPLFVSVCPSLYVVSHGYATRVHPLAAFRRRKVASETAISPSLSPSHSLRSHLN